MGKVLSRGFYVQKAFSVNNLTSAISINHLRDVATVLGRMSGSTEEERGLIGWRTENKRLVTPDTASKINVTPDATPQKYTLSKVRRIW